MGVNKRLENERLITRLTKISGSSPTSLKDRYMVNAARLRLQLCSLQSALEAKSQAWAHAPEFVPRSNSMSSSDTGNGLNVSATPFVMSNSSAALIQMTNPFRESSMKYKVCSLAVSRVRRLRNGGNRNGATTEANDPKRSILLRVWDTFYEL